MLHFRLADSADTHLVAILIASLFEEVGHTQTAREIAEIFAAVENDDRHSTLLAFDDEDAVGIITVSESIAFYAGGEIGVINELYVLPEWRSEGVGKLLLDQMKEIAFARGWRRLEVTTPGEAYDRTIRFYEREGFFPIGPRMKWEV